MARMFHHFGWPLAMSVSVEETAKDAKDSMATACATLCYPDAVRSRNTGETLRPLCGSIIVEMHQGFSIGSNDMTQLTLGLDRDSGLVAESFDERNPAVKKMLSTAIQAARKAGKYIGICGQGPSDHPDLAEWLMEQGIESVSLNPDTVVDTWLYLARKEK